MRQLWFVFAIAICSFSISACSERATVVSETEPPVVSQEQEEEPKSKANGFLDFANKLIDKVDENSDQAEKAKQWMNDKFGGESGGDPLIPEDAAQWATEAFNTLKDKGMTSADSASQWLTEDIRNMNALKYKIVTVSFDDLEKLEDELNRMGQLRWDCFHVTEKDGKSILFFKKERRSLLKNIPVRDMMKLVPLMGSGE